MPAFLRRFAVAGLLATWMTQAWAIDPIALFLLNMLRNRIATELAERVIEEVMKPPVVERYVSRSPLVAPLDAAEVERRSLRRTIDDGFAYLSETQREQVLAGVSQVLADPAYESERAAILAEFTQTARAIGEVYRVLQQLSADEKKELAARARTQFQKLPPADRDELQAHLRARRLPLPHDLSDMLLTEAAMAHPSTDMASNPAKTPPTAPLLVDQSSRLRASE